jgi:hypothetical protein
LRFLERAGLVAFNQCARDGLNRGTGFNGRGTGDIGNQRLAEFLRVAQIRVGLNERFRSHAKIIAEAGAPYYPNNPKSWERDVAGVIHSCGFVTRAVAAALLTTGLMSGAVFASDGQGPVWRKEATTLKSTAPG